VDGEAQKREVARFAATVLSSAPIDALSRVEDRSQPSPALRERQISMHVVYVHQQTIRGPDNERDAFTRHHPNPAFIVIKFQHNEVSDAATEISVIGVVSASKVQIHGDRAKHRVLILEFLRYVPHKLSLPPPVTV
jgi:hypothetical protein